MSVVNIASTKNVASAVNYYMTKKEANTERVGGFFCSLGTADKFIDFANKITSESNREIQAYTLIQSFPEDEFDVTSQEDREKCMEMASKLVERLYPNSPYLVALHIDTGHLHAHMAVLNHDFESGGCIRSNLDFRHVSYNNDKLMRENNLSTPTASTAYKWEDELRNKIENVLKQSKSMDEFNNMLNAEGIETNFYRKGTTVLLSHPSVAFVSADGKRHRKRLDALSDSYTSEALEMRFKGNTEAPKPIPVKEPVKAPVKAPVATTTAHKGYKDTSEWVKNYFSKQNNKQEVKLDESLLPREQREEQRDDEDTFSL